VTTSKLVVLEGAAFTMVTGSFVDLIVLLVKVWLPLSVAKVLYSDGSIVA
jgi:hypothetical protein